MIKWTKAALDARATMEKANFTGLQSVIGEAERLAVHDYRTKPGARYRVRACHWEQARREWTYQ